MTLQNILAFGIIVVVSLSVVLILSDTASNLFQVANVMVAQPVASSANIPELNESVPVSSSSFESQKYKQHLLGLLVALIATVFVVFSLVHKFVNNTDEIIHQIKPTKLSIRSEQTDALEQVLGKRNTVKSELRDHYLELFNGTMPISYFMSKRLKTVSPDDTLKDCESRFEKNGYRRMMVTDSQNELVGVISRKDLASKNGDKVVDVMTSDPITITPETNLKIALSILLQHRITCLPVVNEKALVGLVSTSDLMVVLQSMLVVLEGMDLESVLIEFQEHPFDDCPHTISQIAENLKKSETTIHS